jgi:hypothetical protein
MHISFPCEVDIAFVSFYSFCAVDRLRESSGGTERIRAGRGRSIEILPLECLSVDGHWRCLSVVTLGHTMLELFIVALLGATPHSSLNDQLIISFNHGDSRSILCSHHFFADGVDSQIFGTMLGAVPGLEVTLL